MTATRVCPKQNKILYMFSFPGTMKCNIILIMPFPSDRSIELNNKFKQACWLGKASQVAKVCDYFNKNIVKLRPIIAEAEEKMNIQHTSVY